MNTKVSYYITAVLLVIIFLSGCATTFPMFMDRQSRADNIAVKSGFVKEYIRAGDFNLLSYQKIAKSSETIRIYIEGDGNAWETKHSLSDDPTPRQPVALYLACKDTFASIVYIARPGQYSSSGFADCDSKYWSGSRFASEIIVSFNRAIDILKEKSNAKYIELIGYSGGAAIVVFVAARRSDVIALRTVAGNLNPHMLSIYHRVSQLEGSLDPLDVVQEVAHIPQRHFVGSKDKIVPFAIAESFVKMEQTKDYECITVVDDASHNEGWQKRWQNLLLLQPL